MNHIREELERRYQALFAEYHLARPLDAKNICSIIRQSLRDFLQNAGKPAIYCRGGHTEMLMADFMNELKKVRYIVDNYAERGEDTGFILLRDQEIEEQGIDAIILSSYKFRNDLKQSLQRNHPDIPVLDIYDEFEQRGIMLQTDYYYSNHPYQHYKRINQLQREIRGTGELPELRELYRQLVTKYIHIKDFRTAAIRLKEWMEYENPESEEAVWINRLQEDVTTLYDLQLRAAASLSEDHVLMLCIDGLRRQDLSAEDMPKLSRELEKSAFLFENAYSFSTSTYESLIPVYSENEDLRTGYFNSNSIPEEECRFVREAKKQGRGIFFYTDTDIYVESKSIAYSGTFQTATEKIWSFILDALDEKKGLFYIHVVYESHYSFSNPYTEDRLISEGTAMLFDFLPQKGGRLRTDYERQHLDSLHYLDDVLTPVLERIPCRMLMYADHGNLVLENGCDLSDIPNAKLNFAEEWIRIPCIIRSPEMGKGKSGKIISLMSLTHIVISLLNQNAYMVPENSFIKVARSELYNPDFRYLYKQMGKERCLLAFETFIFAEGYKLVVYSDGRTELWLTGKDERCENDEIKKDLFEKIRTCITVCNIEKVSIC